MTTEFNPEYLNVRRAGEADAEAIAALYDSVRISEKNYKEKIDPDSENSFKRTGGMFCALGREDVLTEMRTGKSDFFIAAYREDPRLLAVLWLSEENHEIENIEEWLRVLPEGKVLFARDFINVRVPGISDMLPATPLTSLAGTLVYALAFQTMRSRGYSYALSEVYHITAYNDETGSHPLSVINASFEKIKHIGAGILGDSIPRQVRPYPRDPASVLSFTITPCIICFDLAIATGLLEKMVNDVL
jgi:hypothetical protein